ncbi:16940_t:CDS:2 [Dentiscutata erythropus]|uniref:16940_t:CDS:1 n=1 Tax=Dentiscutata erythropus TaxID=1348616 RepID=A0A9N9I9P5_9GLOM|nr:16940_t:CDS:2 [Dentiscutata erythropus]
MSLKLKEILIFIIFQILAIKFEPSIKETSHKGAEPKLKREIYEIISSANFWTNIQHSVELTNANTDIEICDSDSVNSSNSEDDKSLKNREIIEPSENREIAEYLDDEADNKHMNVEDFDDYLQEWVEMLEEERQRFEGENIEDEEELSLDDIAHPAIDTNAKWELATLFKKLDLKNIF